MEPEVISSGTSSVEVNVNAKGEPSFKVKVYAGTSEEELSDIAKKAIETMAKLRSGSFGAV